MVRGKNDKFIMEKVPDAHDTNMILMLKPGYQPSVTLYSTDNRNNSAASLFIFIDQFGTEAVSLSLKNTTRFTGKRFLKGRDDISSNSGTWICVNELCNIVSCFNLFCFLTRLSGKCGGKHAS